MKFIFPDSQDFVDPSFDYERETRSPTRVRQRDDLYPHELLAEPPYDGMLVSKAVVDGSTAGAGKYTGAQRLRFLREGVRSFFRLDRPEFAHLTTMGDCGAFAYVKEHEPPYTVDEVIDFYAEAGFDLGVAVDHIILGFDAKADQPHLDGIDPVPSEWRERQAITLQMAAEFLASCRSRKVGFTPIAVAQGWSPKSYAKAFEDLQSMGYDYIALGGVVPLKTPEIVACVKAVGAVRNPETKIHLLGVTRLEVLEEFRGHGVASFDSTSPLQRAFKDAKVNYYADPEPYTAIRIPQVDGNPKLQRAIKSGKVGQDRAQVLERQCLQTMRDYDADQVGIETVLSALADYSDLHDTPSRVGNYRRTLEDRPWKSCPCNVCRDLGIHVVMFRGAERNRRRGFHNLFAFRNRMLEQLEASSATPTSS